MTAPYEDMHHLRPLVFGALDRDRGLLRAVYKRYKSTFDACRQLDQMQEEQLAWRARYAGESTESLQKTHDAMLEQPSAYAEDEIWAVTALLRQRHIDNFAHIFGRE